MHPNKLFLCNATQWNKRNAKIYKQVKIKCKIILLKTLENRLNKSYFMTYHTIPIER